MRGNQSDSFLQQKELETEEEEEDEEETESEEEESESEDESYSQTLRSLKQQRGIELKEAIESNESNDYQGQVDLFKASMEFDFSNKRNQKRERYLRD